MQFTNIFSDWKKFLRLVILLIIFVIGYFHIILLLWGAAPQTVIEIINIGLRILGWSVLIFYVLTFLSIDLRGIKFGYIELISILVLLLIVGWIYYFIPYSTPLFFKLMAIIIFHLGVHIFLRYKYSYLTNRIINSSWGIVKYGLTLYAFLMTLVITLFMTIELIQTPLECNEVAEYVEDTTPNRIINIQEGGGNLLSRSDHPVGEFLETLDSGSFWYMRLGGLIENVQADQELVRLSFCEIIANLVQGKIGQGVSIVAVMIIMFILLFPVLTLVYRIFQLGIWLLIKLLTWLGVYKREKRMREVKELK